MAESKKTAELPAAPAVESAPVRQTRQGVAADAFSMPFGGHFLSYKSGASIVADWRLYDAMVANHAPVSWAAV